MTDLVTPEPTTTVVDDPKKPWKAVVAAVIAVALIAVPVVQTAFSDGVWSVQDTFTVILAVLGAVGVYFVPNPKVVDRGNSL